MEWRDIVGYEGFLQVSDQGDVRSVERDLHHRNDTTMVMKSKILKARPDPKGYLKVRTSVNNEKTSIKVHRAVAEAFIPNASNKPQVDHIDGNKSNNNVSNLRWVTNKENYDYSVANGLRVGSALALKRSKDSDIRKQNAAKSVRERMSKKTYCYDKNMNLLAIYDSNTLAAMAVNGCQSGVSACCCHSMPTYKGYIFRYEGDRSI